MRVSERVLKWAMRCYPPLLFQRIWVICFKKGFKGVSVKIKKSFFNRNYNHSIFGGTIFSAADPFYPVLFHQILTHKGYRVRVWLKSAQIQFLKPGRTTLFFNIEISDEDILEIEEVLNGEGKFVKSYPIEIHNKNRELCVLFNAEIYIRNIDKY
jgi:hypothetical protein